jgi:signal transduction histidine kinase
LIKRNEIRGFLFRHGYLLIAAGWLVTLAFLANNYWLYNTSPKGVQHSIQRNLGRREEGFYKITDDSVLMQKFLNRNFGLNDLKKLSGINQDFYLFFYEGDWETFWTTDQIAFGNGIATLPDGVYFKKLQNGYYEIIRKDLGMTSLGPAYVLGFIPVKEEYYFTNRYLPNRYYQLPRIGDQYVINMKGGGLPVFSSSGQQLFTIQFQNGNLNKVPSLPGGILLALAVISFLIFVNLLAVFIGTKTNKWWGFLFLCVFIVTARYITYVVPFSYNNYHLFDATIYASNEILRSLGDLLIDVLLVTWIILYASSQLYEKLHLPKMSQSKKYVGMFLLSLIIYYASYLGASIIRGLVINSKISFDVTDFFSLTVYSVIGFCILGLLVFSFFFFSLIINDLLDQLSGYQNNLKYIVFGTTGIIWLLLQLLHTTDGYVVALMIWSIFYLYMLDVSRQQLGKELKLPQFILWLFIMTLSVTALLVHYNTRHEFANREQLAMKLSKQKDPTLEFNLGMIDTSLVKDPSLISYLRLNGNKLKEKDGMIRHLLNNYFSNIQNKYDFHFYMFNNTGNSIGSRDSAGTKSALDQVLQHSSEPASVNNVYYHEVSFSNFSYIARLQVDDPVSDSTLGYLYYELKPKTIKRETLYPKLLMKSEDNRTDNLLSKYSYAVYDHLNLVYNRNDYPFALHLSMKDIPFNEFRTQNENGYSFLWYKPAKDKLVVVVKQNRMVIETITLFAYMFCIFLLLILIYRVIGFSIRTRLRSQALRNIFNLTIQTRVHIIIVFIVVFVFIVLGVSTISFFIRRYDIEHRESLSSGMSILLNGVEKAIQGENGTGALITSASIDSLSPVQLTDLKNDIQGIADTHGVDINIYDVDGNLKVSTQNLIYENGILSSKMDPEAYYKLDFMHQVQVIQNEQVGNLKFLSSYASIRNVQGKTIAFLNQPYFASQVDLQQEISNFLVTLINLNAFIFLLSGLLALLFTNSITKSFKLIGEKLQHINFTGKNEEIAWKGNDEIGQLVKEYNKMVHKLEESAAALAKSEREGAWREMARQVAHEIKNPLTPMKLSLQHLERAIDQDSPKAYKLTKSVAATLIEQIEHLSQIASDFSAFANIAYANNENVLLNEVLHSVTSLHNGYEQIKVSYLKPAENYYVFADKTQLNRLFTNLVQNAMQSIPEDKKGLVSVDVARYDGQVIVSVKDNGDGIPDEIRSKIFTPNFTTKSSGTGLGLAMSKNIVEHAHGEIWFETTEGVGTTFYVRFPLML